jgi:hypothetical protein
MYLLYYYAPFLGKIITQIAFLSKKIVFSMKNVYIFRKNSITLLEIIIFSLLWRFFRKIIA